jgi:hypothetical protein
MAMRIRRAVLAWVSAAVLVATLGFLATGGRLGADARKKDATPTGTRVPVVVELFTSEGCSSCPPADALLARLDQQQPVPGVEVIALEEHVDYWDQLGWRDPFSSSDWTERQRSYAQAFRTDSIYTPQMIVNGSAEFVGSRERQGKNAIEEAARQATVPVKLSAAAANGQRVAEVTVQVGRWEGAPAAEQLEVWLAVTETGLHSAVSRGENAGETLYHAAVVRKLQKLGTVAAKPVVGNDEREALTAKISIDSGWKAENLQVVAFVQARRTLRIYGAGRVRLGS